MFKISSPNHPALHAAPARRAKLLAFVFLLIAGVLSTARVYAQTTATVDGVVRDTDKALVPGAQITMVNEQDKSKRTTTSNAEGFFTLAAIQPSTWDVIVTMKGFETYRVNGLAVHPGDSIDIPKIELKIGEITQEVTVSADAAGVNLDSPERSSIITAEDINRISTVGRDATELIRFLPGFAASTGGGLSNVPSWQNSQNAGFGGSSVSSFSANGATPQTGATTVVSDGASVMDPGDMGASIQNVNMNQVQEISVETSNFGADQAHGPVVINAVGKSGTSNYHGEVYMVARNTVLNSNDWYSNFEGVARPQTKYFYPGVDVSGPVKIPGTNFNHSKKLTFFGAFEYYDQTVPDGQATNGTTGLVQSFVPTIATGTTPGMLTASPTAASGFVGDLTPSTIASALNVSVAKLQGACPNFYTTNGTAQTLNGSGGFCYSPGSLNGSEYTQQDCIFAAGVVQGNSPNAPASNAANCPSGSLLPVDPHALIWAKYWPKPNRTPQAVPSQSLLSDGFNYEKTILDTLNGYQLRGRVDDSITDSLKFYATYNFEKVNSEIAIDNVYYAGSDEVPYPTPAFTYTKSNGVSLNLTKVFGATLTNEAIFAGAYYYSPNQLQNRNLVQDATTGWSGGRYYNNGATQLPGIRDYENGVPDFAMGYFPSNSAFLRKFSYDGADNLTKQIRTHAVKVGVYAEVTANNQVPYNFTQGLYQFNHYNAGCYTNDGSGDVSQLQNNVANLFQTCNQYTQSSSSINADLHFHNVDFYATDEWKATKRLTLTLGIRFDHLGAWFDPDGLGMAVWTPPAQHTLFTSVTQNPDTYPGISWHQTNPSDPISGQASRALFYSPRVGLAYDLYGDGRTTMRGGWGAYRFHDSYNDSAGPLGTTQGIQSFATSSNLSCTALQVQNQGSGNAALTGKGVGCPTTGSPFAIYAFDKSDNEQPVTYNYNFTVDQQLPFNANFEVGYVGNQSAHTFTEGNLSNQNYIPLGGLFQPDPITGAVTQPSSTQQNQQDYYPYPNYTDVYVPHHIGYGNYNALQTSFTKQKGRFLLRANYTWAKALGIRGDYRTGAVGDPSNLRNNYGYLGFNRNNAVNFVYSYQFGKVVKNKLLGGVINNWEIDGVTQIQSGPDVAVLTGGGNFSLSGAVSYTPTGSTTAIQVPVNNTDYLGTPNINLQPTVLCDPRVNLHNQANLGHQYFNGSCFGLPKFGTNGDFELPDTHGPALFDTDLTVRRAFKFTEKQNLQISIAGFNFINHPLYAFTGGNNIGLALGYGSPANNTATTPAQAFASAVQTTTNFGYTPYKEGFRIVTLQAKYSF